MVVTLPFPPTANLYWRIWRGRAVTSAEARAYRQTAGLAAKAQGLRPILEGEVALRLRVFRPTRRGDLDNRLKVLLDALRGIAYRDDAQVAYLQASQTLDAKRPRVEVDVTYIGATPEEEGPRGPAIHSAHWTPSAT